MPFVTNKNARPSPALLFWQKLVLTSGLCMVMLAAGLMITSYWSMQRAGEDIGSRGGAILEETNQRYLSSIVAGQADTMDHQLDQAKNAVLIGVQTLETILAAGRRPEERVLRVLLDNSGPYTTTIYYIPRDGTAIVYLRKDVRFSQASSFSKVEVEDLPDIADKPTNERAAAWSAVHTNPYAVAYDRVIDAVSPVYVKDQIAGILGISVSVIRLTAQFNHRQAIRGSYNFLLDSNKQLMACPPLALVDLTPAGQVGTGRRILDLSSTDNTSFQSALHTMALGNESVDNVSFPSGEKYLAYRPLDNANLRLGLAVPVALASITTRELAKTTAERSRRALIEMIMVSILLLGLTLVVVALISRKMSRPLKEITAAADEISNGQLDQLVPVTSRDEIGTLATSFNTMSIKIKERTREQQQAEEAWRRAEHRYRSIFENAVEGICRISPDGRLLIANPSFASILGYTSPQQSIEGNTSAGRDLFAAEKHWAEFCHRIQKERVMEFVTRFKCQNQGLIWVSIKARYVVDDTGSGLYYEGMIQDISLQIESQEQMRLLNEQLEQRVQERTRELQGVNKELEQAIWTSQALTKEAEAANVAKSQFLANMSHEIRTPLNVIVGLTNILIKSKLTASQRGYLDKVKVASRNLLEVINDILDFSKVEAGRLELEPVPFDLVQVFERMADLFSHRVAHKDLELVYALAPQTPRWLTGDDGRLIQVLTNLIENAIKFTEAGEIVVSVAPDPLTDQRTGPTFLKFQVNDTGAGIDADVLPSLFDPFTQADGSLTRKHEGTGLGLAICKRLVKLMDGTIEAHSTLGMGSRFVFTAKLMINPEKDTGRYLPLNVRGLKVLVVDDNAAARQVMVHMLESLAFKVTAVDSGEKSIEVLLGAKDDPYQLVLLDLMMPGMDGIETARRIKTRVFEEHETMRHETIPPMIILMTAYGRAQVKSKIEKVQMDAMLLKPVKPSELYKVIMTLFGHASDSAAHLHERQGGQPIHSLSDRRVLVVEDSGLNRDVAIALLEDMGMTVEIAENGKVAVDKVTVSRMGLYDAVLMDIQMPVMDGYEATRHIRAWEADRRSISTDSEGQNIKGRKPKIRLPIIALTAHAIKGEKQKSLNADMDDFLSKPIDEQELFRVLQRWITP